MKTPFLNWLLFSFFSILATIIFISTLLLPKFRSHAYAPLRELILPPPRPIELSLLLSTEKEAWMEEVLQKMENHPLIVDGNPVQVNVEMMGSREMYLSILDGKYEPDIISPASSLQINLLEDLSRNKFGEPLVLQSDQQYCRKVLLTPLVLVFWADRAEVLWGNNPNGNMWVKIKEALTDPEGWSTFGKPEWGYVKFGHTDPTRSNSGFMTIVLMAYDYIGKTNGMTVDDILSNEAFQQWLKDFEGSISDFGSSTGTYMKDIIAYGPSKYDMVAVYEATAIEHLKNAEGRYGELIVYYPPATIMSDHPFCVINAEWVTPEKRKAAQAFIDRLTSQELQEIALLKYGFRPANSQINIDQHASPFVIYTDNGLKLDIPPEIELPSGDVLDTLLQFWIRNIQQ
jgi:ABC-type Fe3+ transport system substrate-binding protein